MPFVTSVPQPTNTPMAVAKDLAKRAMKKVKTEMIGKTGTSE